MAKKKCQGAVQRVGVSLKQKQTKSNQRSRPIVETQA